MTIEQELFRIHEGLPRLAPGSEGTTLRILKGLGKLPRQARVLELGCGTGAATLVLAKRLKRALVAVDAHRPFLLQLRQTLKSHGVSENVETRHADIAQLPEKLGKFELIWAEGASYILGFETALLRWRPFLSSGGRAVVSEPTYLSEQPHADVKEYWSSVYPGISTLVGNCAAAERAGYNVAETVALSAKDYKAYYAPIRARIAQLRGLGQPSVELAAFMSELEEEMRLFERFPEDIGYVFYLLESPSSDDASYGGEPFSDELPQVDLASTARRGKRGPGAGSEAGTRVSSRAFDVAVAPSNAVTHRQLEAQIVDLIGAVGLNRARDIFEQVSRSLSSVR